MRTDIYLPEVVGRGYGRFWRFKGRYRVCKGSRASKKSKTTALNLVSRMMAYPGANALVVRKVYRTLRDSCFAELKWAVKRLEAERWWSWRENPMEMTYLPTGQKIFFRGLDDPFKVASITVERGYLCWLWVEEAYEIAAEADFEVLDESIRGAVPEETGLFKQVTLTFNPWSERHWLKRRFFDPPRSVDVLAMTTDYRCNEWLDEADRRLFEEMRRTNPRRYRVAGLGEWGVEEGLIYADWEERAFPMEEVKRVPDAAALFGLDFGYTLDPSALCCAAVSRKERTIWVFDELYERGLTNRALAERVKAMGYAKERIRADAAEPKSIAELREEGLFRVRPARKGSDSVRNGIQYLQGYHMVVHPRCVNFLTEIGSYSWGRDRNGGWTGRPAEGGDHLMDALRYAVEDVMEGPAFSFQ